MVLRELIEFLKNEPQEKKIKHGFGSAHSYRGYYARVAFSPVTDTTVGEMLKHAKKAKGSTYTGWKGGDFTMHGHTDTYIAHQGDYGENDEITAFMLTLILENAVHKVIPNTETPWNTED